MDSQFIAFVASLAFISCSADSHTITNPQVMENENITLISLENSQKIIGNSSSYQTMISFSEESQSAKEPDEGGFKDIEAISTVDLSREHYLFQATLAKMF